MYLTWHFVSVALPWKDLSPVDVNVSLGSLPSSYDFFFFLSMQGQR